MSYDNEFLRASQHWQSHYQKAQKALNEKANQFIDIQAETKLLSHELINAKQTLNDVQDQNKLLSHDKWILAQEKAQLEGQLKQLQKMITA